MRKPDNGPMLNAYPDSVGGTLSDIISFLKKPEMEDTFQSFYILPSIFNTDLDRGFSVIDYSLNELIASQENLNDLKALGIDLKLDFILNHASVLSPQFQDILKHGESSKYIDFFIRWNEFWKGHGKMTAEGYIQPDQDLIKNMFFRKPGLPILMVRMPNGTKVPYWNTFYQEIRYPKIDPQDLMEIMTVQYATADVLAEKINRAVSAGETLDSVDFGKYENQKEKVINHLEEKCRYLGQMDLNIQSPLVWEHYDNTLKTLASYGASIVRLDAFAYAPKQPGLKNFMNDPGTWDLLAQVQELADKYHLQLLPEIHTSYQEKTYELLASKGYMTYDFFLPGLIIDAFEERNGAKLKEWADELVEKKIRVVNMLGCHDGIPLLDLKGLLADEEIDRLIHTVVDRGGYVKNLHGAKNMYYQVNATYYSALGEDDRKMLIARALQMFMPGKPQVWYLDLFAGKNDHEAVARAGAGGHKEINRTNFSLDMIEEGLKQDVVKKQIELLHFRSNFPAFGFDASFHSSVTGNTVCFQWENQEYTALMKVNFETLKCEIHGTDENQKEVFSFTL